MKHFHGLSNGCIYKNLAIEQNLLRESTLTCIYTWKASPCVVIGRNQNPWKECDLNYMKMNNIKLARRQSGGGTVYHDDGNLNFSLITDRSTWHKDDLLMKIKNYISTNFNVNLNMGDKGDLLEETGRKVSGSAYCFAGDRVLHHCTLLINSNLTTLQSVLQSPLSIKDSSISSRPSKCANLNIDIDLFLKKWLPMDTKEYTCYKDADLKQLMSFKWKFSKTGGFTLQM